MPDQSEFRKKSRPALKTIDTPACLIQEHVRLFFLKKKSTLCALIRHYSIVMIRPCAFINFLIYFHPVRLLSPVRLLGTPEYAKICVWDQNSRTKMSWDQNVSGPNCETALTEIVQGAFSSLLVVPLIMA